MRAPLYICPFPGGFRMTSNARRTGLLAAASMVSLAFAASAQAKDESHSGGGVDLRTDNPAVGLDLADISPFQSLSLIHI